DGTAGRSVVVASVGGGARNESRNVRFQQGLHEIDDGFRNRIDPRLRNLVVRERTPAVGSVGIRLRGRIVNLVHLPAGIHVVVQVARVKLRRRNAIGTGRGPDAVAEALVGDEEERLVFAVVQLGNPHRTAYRDSEIVLLVDRLGGAVEAFGVQILVAQEFIYVAMHLVGARLGHETHRAAGRVAHIGFEAAGGHAEFRQRVY